MIRKIVLIFLSLFLVTACTCHSMPIFSPYNLKPVYMPDPFLDNPRICFRDITVLPGMSNAGKYKKAGYIALNQTIPSSFVSKIQTVSIREAYGSSVNDGFNGVTKPVLPKPIIKNRMPQPKTQSVASALTLSSATANREPPKNMPQETTYVPLTFPIPPPDAMVKQFHMKVGSSDIYGEKLPRTMNNHRIRADF